VQWFLQDAASLSGGSEFGRSSWARLGTTRDCVIGDRSSPTPPRFHFTSIKSHRPITRKMAPLRRYLRITKHSVLEVRIYLDRPADADAWLLKREDPALPRVIQAVRPHVLPKLREENERGKGKGGAKARKKGVKDLVVEGKSYGSVLRAMCFFPHLCLQ
jgi:hypothetical protein